jgi:P-type E1-E2 ATPase
MITGDHPQTAKAIGLELGIITETDTVVSGKELMHMPAKELEVVLKRTNIFARVSPEDKLKIVSVLQNQGEVVAMTGDGINDAPALALADVGMVFSNEEQTAASEAADIVLLGGDFALVADSLMIARRTISIAMQSILWGIGLSVVAMVFASVGLIPPLIGAGIQEAIDVAVILNALRASR